MGKIADKYYLVDPWLIIERDFDPSYELVSESVFSLGNEYMGVRGYFEEGYSGEGHVGSYFNGFYEESPIYHPARYKGFVDISRDMTNSVDWLYTRIILDDEQLDLAQSQFEEFSRTLNLKTGILNRSFIWTTKSGKKLKLSFERLLSMKINHVGCQRIEFEPINFTGEITVISGMDFTPHAPHQTDSNWVSVKTEKNEQIYSLMAQTQKSKLRLYSSFRIDGPAMYHEEEVSMDRIYGTRFCLKLEEGKVASYDKIAVNYAAKKHDVSEEIWDKGFQLAQKYSYITYDQVKSENMEYWKDIWNKSDIIIENDMENQQGIRFCIFQLHQTYRGSDSSLNIGAKGLSGEGYGGKAYWDTEAYCLQFYIFNKPEAAKKLLGYRYNLLPEARDRAKQLDCEGACYPISTIDGIETCGAWQHSSLQIHVSGAIAYGIFHYDNICKDKEFLYSKGIEMLLEISRFYKSRVQKNPITGEYGYYGVMGVDEFHMMVNNNCFTNYLAKKAMEFTLQVVDEMKVNAKEELDSILDKLMVNQEELDLFKKISANMNLPQKENGLYEQHDGFFTLPHIDLDSIPVTDFPLYHNWSYDRIYRTDMIKQPDVLMMLFMYSNDFSKEVKAINYDYYEPKCIHESSLSPSVHSIIASEIGRHKEAYKLFQFATRLDLDNYNRNTDEGLHITSIAAAWMNIVYGFGGMRSDGAILSFSPSIPEEWSSYQFSILIHNSLVHIKVSKENVHFEVKEGSNVDVAIYGKRYTLGQEGLTLDYPNKN